MGSAWKELVALVIAVIVRILMGYLSQRYPYLTSWTMVFNIVCIGIAVIAAIHIIVVIVNSFGTHSKKE